MKKNLKEKLLKYFGIIPFDYPDVNEKKERSPKQEFTKVVKDIGSAFILALIVIQFVIQAFKIPTGSMEDTLLVGDFLLGLKFVYGSPVPFTYKKLPGIKEPEKNDVVIFKYPGDPNYPENDEERYVKLLNTFVFGIIYWDKDANSFVLYRPKDFIKRCVAVSGDTIAVKSKELFVNNEKIPNAIHGKHMDSRVIPYKVDPRDNCGPYIIPSKNDTIDFDSDMSIREFFWYRSLVYQENPKVKIISNLKFYVDDSLFSNIEQKGALYIKYSNWDWHFLQSQIDQYKKANPDKKVYIKKEVYLKQKPLKKYVLKHNAYFMMGDNRDNSLDSRYWGYVSKKFVNAKALIIYFSWDGYETIFNKIRFSRIGKLIF